MLKVLRRMLSGNKGFTLVELMTVLVILGIILGIGVPKYLRIQNQAEWDADAAVIKGFAKEVEMYVIKNDVDLAAVSHKVSLKDLLGDAAEGSSWGKVIDGSIVLNRKKEDDKSVKNTDALQGFGSLLNVEFKFDQDFGTITNVDEVITALIGNPLY